MAGRYAGQEGRDIGWVRHRTADSLGLVNLAQAIAPAKEAVGYAYAELTSPRDLAGQGSDPRPLYSRGVLHRSGRDRDLRGVDRGKEVLHSE